MSDAFHVRNLKAGEQWPDALFMGFEGPMLEREWAFVVEHNGRVCGALLTAPMHGILFLIRVAMRPNAPLAALRALLKYTFESARLRGLQGYMTLINPTTREGSALLGLVRSVDGVQWPEPIVLAWGFMRDIFREQVESKVEAA